MLIISLICCVTFELCYTRSFCIFKLARRWLFFTLMKSFFFFAQFTLDSFQRVFFSSHAFSVMHNALFSEMTWFCSLRFIIELVQIVPVESCWLKAKNLHTTIQSQMQLISIDLIQNEHFGNQPSAPHIY